jgi:hypothetical protein
VQVDLVPVLLAAAAAAAAVAVAVAVAVAGDAHLGKNTAVAGDAHLGKNTAVAGDVHLLAIAPLLHMSNKFQYCNKHSSSPFS